MSRLVRPLAAGRGTSRNLSNLQVFLQQSVVTGLVAAVSIAAAILSLLGNRRAWSKTKRVKFVLLLTSATAATWARVWFGGELSPVEREVSVRETSVPKQGVVWSEPPAPWDKQESKWGLEAASVCCTTLCVSCGAFPARLLPAFEFQEMLKFSPL